MRTRRNPTRLAIQAVTAALLTATGAWHATAATITIQNNDGAGVGFNDPTAVAAVGDNPQTTLGAQRLAAFQFAADAWGAVLASDVEIRVAASFPALACTATSALLGSASASDAFSDFPGAPLAGTWYHAALADSLAGADLDPGGSDIVTNFNVAIDSGCLGGISGWYYGLDGNAPPDRIDIVQVLLHELAHGLGFANFVNESSGSLLLGTPDIYSVFTRDDRTGQTWVEMATNAERAASAVRCRSVSWSGAAVTAETAAVLDSGVPELRVTAPASIAGSYAVGTAAFGPALTAPGVSAALELVDDGVDAGTDACEPLLGFTPGNIALVDRGICTFVEKVANAEAAGAVAVVIADNAAGCPPPGLGGTSAATIPSVRISLTDGNRIKSELDTGVTATLTLDAGRLVGADEAGRALLYAVDPVVLGSSISHFESFASPDLLMEPANAKQGYDLDLTVAQMVDIGWYLATCGDGLLDDYELCDDGDTADGDGCSARCRVEECWSCDASEPSVCATAAAMTACTDDDNECSDDVCDGAGLCTHLDNAAGCDDGVSCTDDDNCSAGLCTATWDGGCALDAFKVYRAKAAKGATKFAGAEVELADALETKTTDARKVRYLANPADVDGEGVRVPEVHLECYQIKDTKTVPKQARFAGADVSAVDRFGAWQLGLTKPSMMCTPAAADRLAAPSPLAADFLVDDFKCYRARATGDGPAFSGAEVGLSDDFETKTTTVDKPSDVCLSVDVDGEGIDHAGTGMVCYKIKDSRTVPQPPLAATDAFFTQRFGSEALTAKKTALLCVPATVAPL